MARCLLAVRADTLADSGALRHVIDTANTMNRFAGLRGLGRDFRHALHVLRRAPAFTATALVTLALVIGANTAVFTLTDEILIEPLPYPEPGNLAYVEVAVRTSQGNFTIRSHDGTTWERLRDDAVAVDVAVTVGVSAANLSTGNVVSVVEQERVSAGFFGVLGAAPLIGREFSGDEDRPGGPPVAVLSYDLWQRVFDGDRAAVGRTLLLRGEAYDVVGVMPQGFRSISGDVDVWTPVRPSPTGEGSGTNYDIVARVRPGRPLAEATAALPALDDDYFRRVFGTDAAAVEPVGRFALAPLQRVVTANTERPLLMLVAAAMGVLLIACVNLATLLLSRAGSRRREIATRIALGSGRGAVVRQLFMESVVLAVAGGALGVVVGQLCLDALIAIGASTYDAWAGVTLDLRALAATAGLALATSVLFGLFPAVEASRLDVSAALSGSAGRSIAGGARDGVRRVLVGGQIALCVVLLVVCGLLMRTFVNLATLEPGFDPNDITTASVSLLDARYATADRMNALFDESLRRLSGTPGVESAAVSLSLPYQRLLNLNFAFADEAEPTGPRIANVMYATTGFFETLRIPVVAGRAFAETDTASTPPVVVVNADFVDMIARGENPIGHRIRIGGVEREIVGVAGNVKIAGAGFELDGMLEGPLTSAPLVYLPAAQITDGFMGLHVWYSPTWTARARDARLAEAALREAIGGADPLLPIASIRSMSEIRADATAEQRLLMWLVGVLAAAALLLAAVGLYGLVAHAVGERRRELGVRMALGATASRTARSIALSGVATATIGAAVGLGLAWVAARVLASRSMFWGVDAEDPATFAAVALFLLVVAAVASLVPALGILKLEPARALRE